MVNRASRDGFYEVEPEYVRNNSIPLGVRTVGLYDDFIVSEKFPVGFHEL